MAALKGKGNPARFLNLHRRGRRFPFVSERLDNFLGPGMVDQAVDLA
jgi:hypothetical protein